MQFSVHFCSERFFGMALRYSSAGALHRLCDVWTFQISRVGVGALHLVLSCWPAYGASVVPQAAW